MKMLYDESHNQTWSLRLAKSIEMAKLSNSLPDYFSYSHLKTIIEQDFNGEVVLADSHEKFVTEMCDCDIVFINHCVGENVKHPSVGGGQFSKEDIKLLVNFVRDGGGIVVLGEYNNQIWGSNINDLLGEFGFNFNDDVAVNLAQIDGEDKEISVFNAEVCEAYRGVDQQPLSVEYLSGCTLSISKDCEVILKSPQGKILGARSQHGAGKIVAIGDSDLFASNHLHKADNYSFLCNILLDFNNEAKEQGSRKLQSKTIGDIRSKYIGLNIGEIEPLEISHEEYDSLSSLVSKVELNPYKRQEAFIENAFLSYHEFPRLLRQKLLEFRKYSNDYGALVIKGLPIDNSLPLTPIESGVEVKKDTFISEFWLACIGSALGEPIAYQQEKQGELFQNVYPVKDNAEKLSSESSKILLDFHTEIAFHPFMPDYVLLFGLRQDPKKQAKTITSSVRHIKKLLTPAEFDLLFENVFKTGIDYSFGSENGLAGNGPEISVLYGSREDPFFRYDLDLMVGLNNKATAVLKVLKDLANTTKREFVIEPGTMAIIDNRRSIHARSQFEARYDGNDRWLQRMSVLRSLDMSFSDRMPGRRLISTDDFEF